MTQPMLPPARTLPLSVISSVLLLENAREAACHQPLPPTVTTPPLPM
ncbi:MAG: hypothetical protein LBC18_10990 [Opitutaceae bacterium]|nr:hypothetical protein [Opitutaceae bacterium]